ncbi:hypothetical protein [Paraburkholderia sp. BR13444]|uniref:hypothetical protein n=1 Tax=Paraburkholderia sp. BR13444 TaxID=3236997 RepID=UPI0034CD8D3F
MPTTLKSAATPTLAAHAATTDAIIRLHADDDVVIARDQLVAGMRVGSDVKVDARRRRH